MSSKLTADAANILQAMLSSAASSARTSDSVCKSHENMVKCFCFQNLSDLACLDMCRDVLV